MKPVVKKSYRFKEIPEEYEGLIEKVKTIATDQSFRWSLSGVPHLLVELKNKVTYSVCYFRRSGTWRVFYPYPGDRQEKRNFGSWEDAYDFLVREAQ
jgi:hypothetical protein